MPLDGQIYWWSSSVRKFAEAGEYERSSFHDVRFGETATEDSHSLFSFSGKRRQKLQAFRQLLLRDNRGNIYDVIDNTYSLLDRYYGTNYRSSVVFSWPGIDENNFYGDNVNGMTLSDIQSVFGSSPSEDQLEASKNRESCHTLSNVARMKDVTHPFIGIHKDKPLTLNTTKNYAGYYIVLERVRFYYDELYIRPIHAQVWSTFMDAPADAVRRFFDGVLPTQYSWFDYYENGELGGHMIFGYNSNPCEEFLYRTRNSAGSISQDHPTRRGENFSQGDRVYALDDYYEDLDDATKLNILIAKGNNTYSWETLYTLQYDGEKDIHVGPDGDLNTEDDNFNFTQNATEFVDNDDIIDVFYDRIPKLFTRAEVGENGFMDWTLAQTSHMAQYYTYNEAPNTWYTYWYYSPGQQTYNTTYVSKSVYQANGNFPLQTTQSNYFGSNFQTWTGTEISYSVQTPTMSSAADAPPSGWEVNADDPFFYNDDDLLLDYGSVDRNRIGVVEWSSVPQATSNDSSTTNPITYDRQTTIDVEDAVIDPQYNRRIQTWTGSVLFKNLTLKIGSNVVNAQNDVYGQYNEMTNEQINNKSSENTPAIIASGASGQKTVTFSNLYAYADKIKFYLEDNFLIVFDGDTKEYEIDTISNSNTITLKDNLNNTLTNSNFTLKIPRGSPNSNYTWGNYKIENFYDSWKEEVWPQNPGRHYDGMCEGWTRDEIIDASNPFDTTWKGTRPHKCTGSETSYWDNRYGPWYDNETSGEPGTYDTTGGSRQLWYRFQNENKYRFFSASKTHEWLDSSRDDLRRDLHSSTSYDYQCYTDLFNILSLGQKEGIIKMPKRCPFFSNEFTEQLMINHNYHGVAYWERMVPHSNNGLFGGVASMSPTEHFIKNNSSERPTFISWDPCDWAKYWEKSFNARITRNTDSLDAQNLLRSSMAEGIICPYNLYSLMATKSNYSGNDHQDATDFKNSYNNQLGSIFSDKDNNNVDVDFRVNEFFWGGLDPASSAIWPNYQNNLAKVSPLAFNYRLSQTYSVFSTEFTEAYGNNNPLINHIDKPWFSFCASERDPSVFQFMVSYEYRPSVQLALAYSMILNPTQNITSAQDHWWQTDTNNDGRILEKWAMDCWTGTNNKVDYVSVSKGSVKATGSSGSKTVTLNANISAIQNKSDTKYFTFVFSGVEYDIISKSGNTLTLGTNLGATFNSTTNFSIRNKRMPNQADLDSREDVKTIKTAWETLLHTKTKKNLLHPWCLAQYGFEPDLTGIMSYFTAEDDRASNGWYGNEQYSRKYGAPHIITIYESNDILSAGTTIELNLHQASAPFNQELKDDVGVAIEDEMLLGDGRSTMPLDSYRLYVVAKFQIDSPEFAEISKIEDNRTNQSTVADFDPEDLPRHDEGMKPGEFG
jgi:hypothetical protein